MLVPIPFAAWHALAGISEMISESAHHSESSGADAGRQRVLAGDARICTTWNFAALFRGDTPPNVMESLIKELPRLIRSKIRLRFGMSELVQLQLVYGVAVPGEPNPEHSQMLHH
jgi:hypothetical protein